MAMNAHDTDDTMNEYSDETPGMNDTGNPPPGIAPAQVAAPAFSKASWLTATAVVWVVGFLTVLVLIVGAGFAVLGAPTRVTTRSTYSAPTATAQPAVVAVSNANNTLEPPVPAINPDYDKMRAAPLFLDVTRSCTATMNYDQATLDPVTRARCATANMPTDMFVLREFMAAGDQKNPAAAVQAFTAGTSYSYIASRMQDRAVFQDADTIFWASSMYTTTTIGANDIPFETFYGAIWYSDRTMRPFAAVYQRINGEWKLRTIDFSNRA